MGRTWNTNGLLVVAGLLTMAIEAPAGGEPGRDLDRPVTSAAAGMASALMPEGATGRLVSSSGQAIAGTQITAQSLDQPARPIPEIAILTDADGRFVWRLHPGRYRLAAVVDGREIAAATATIEPGRVIPVELAAAR